MVRDAKLRGRDAVDFDREGRIVGVLRRESMRPSDAVESLLPLEPLAEYWDQQSVGAFFVDLSRLALLYWSRVNCSDESDRRLSTSRSPMPSRTERKGCSIITITFT